MGSQYVEELLRHDPFHFLLASRCTRGKIPIAPAARGRAVAGPGQSTALRRLHRHSELTPHDAGSPLAARLHGNGDRGVARADRPAAFLSRRLLIFVTVN